MRVFGYVVVRSGPRSRDRSWVRRSWPEKGRDAVMTAPEARPEPCLYPVIDRIERVERAGEHRVVRPAQVSDASSTWVVRAQDGEAEQVLAEIDVAIREGLDPHTHAQALYARALCELVLGDVSRAVGVARELSVYCREHGF